MTLDSSWSPEGEDKKDEVKAERVKLVRLSSSGEVGFRTIDILLNRSDSFRYVYRSSSSK